MEMFEVELDRMIDKWAGSIEIGVTSHSPLDMEFPATMTNIRSGTWMMTGNGVMHNGRMTREDYGQNLDALKVSCSSSSSSTSSSSCSCSSSGGSGGGHSC